MKILVKEDKNGKFYVSEKNEKKWFNLFAKKETPSPYVEVIVENRYKRQFHYTYPVKP